MGASPHQNLLRRIAVLRGLGAHQVRLQVLPTGQTPLFTQEFHLEYEINGVHHTPQRSLGLFSKQETKNTSVAQPTL